MTSEQLIMKSEGVKDCVKHLIKVIKKEQEYLKQDKENYRHFGGFEDCGGELSSTRGRKRN